eukprot:TRINITY_DN2864_c0_g1_i1.p1 TRINITY_DN2864_c0_g1~~TRINITY_DN2864_c0_g1_i1.p1  ORF type:complete len:456 (+),score=152.55 TRINITY_DN2864_c0_g1_i1:101-1468(+)
MDPLGDVSGSGSGAFASAAAPPLGGLGNYKGVMLCNRPDQGLALHGGVDGAGKVPFRSMIAAGARDQLGLQPCKEVDAPVIEVKSRGPSAALRRHLRWVKELQDQVKDDQKRVDEDDRKHAARKDSMQDVFKKQRDAIRQMRREKDGEPLDREALMEVMDQFPPTGATVMKKKKPVWAMTETEKEAFDEQEAADLINFAEGLDFDKFIADQDFKKALQVVHGRARKLQKEQDAFKDDILRQFNGDDGASDYGSAYGGSRPGGMDLPYQRENQDERRELFSRCDPNGNGYASFAEIDNILSQKYGFRQAQKMVMLDCFNQAKNYGGQDTGRGADYIEAKEFRVFLELLQQALGSRLDDGLDGQSLFGELEPGEAASRRRRPGEERYGDRQDWDGSTACGEDRPGVDVETKAAVERALENNPMLRAVHSKESTRRLIEKAKSEGAPATPSVLSQGRA